MVLCVRCWVAWGFLSTCVPDCCLFEEGPFKVRDYRGCLFCFLRCFFVVVAVDGRGPYVVGDCDAFDVDGGLICVVGLFLLLVLEQVHGDCDLRDGEDDAPVVGEQDPRGAQRDCLHLCFGAVLWRGCVDVQVEERVMSANAVA